jgi:osmotically inducible protein OsmC
MPARKADAHWEGSIRDGKGRVRLGSGAFEGQYSFTSRFEDGPGTNPEELLGASHAGCFTMALSLVLSEAGHPPESLDTDATVRIDRDGDGFTITRIDLAVRGRVPGIDEETFAQSAQAAKDNCPLSKALASVPEINLEATLES